MLPGRAKVIIIMFAWYSWVLGWSPALERSCWKILSYSWMDKDMCCSYRGPEFASPQLCQTSHYWQENPPASGLYRRLCAHTQALFKSLITVPLLPLLYQDLFLHRWLSNVSYFHDFTLTHSASPAILIQILFASRPSVSRRLSPRLTNSMPQRLHHTLTRNGILWEYPSPWKWEEGAAHSKG